MADNEHELIHGFLAGESGAYNTINSWITSILELRSWHISIQAASDDIRQEVLVALTQNFRQNKYKGLGLKTYISSVTKFTCLKAFDRRFVAPTTENENDDCGPTALDEIVRNEEYHAVKYAFLQLNKKCRKMLALRFHNDLDHNRIAGIFGIKVEASRQWLKRCLDRLRELVPGELSV